MSSELKSKIERIEFCILNALIRFYGEISAEVGLGIGEWVIDECRAISARLMAIEIEGGTPGDLVLLDMGLPDRKVKEVLNVVTDQEFLVQKSSVKTLLRQHFDLLKRYKMTELLKAMQPETVEDTVSQLIEITDQAFHSESKDPLKEFVDELMEISDGKSTGVKTGFANLDSFLNGMRAGQLVVIGGRPSMGKSAFATNLALNMANQKIPVLYQALEDAGKDIYRRLTSNLMDIEHDHLISGKLTDAAWAKVAKAYDAFHNLPLTIDDAAGLSSMQIVSRVMAQHRRGKAGIVIIDHLQEINEGTKVSYQNRHLEISKILSNLRIMAKRLQIPVIVLSQIGRGVEHRQDKEPFMSDLKESGDIEAKADVVMLLHRPKYYDHMLPEDTLKVIIAKNRNGRRGHALFNFKGDRMRVE